MNWWKEHGLLRSVLLQIMAQAFTYLSTGGNNVTLTPQNSGDD